MKEVVLLTARPEMHYQHKTALDTYESNRSPKFEDDQQQRALVAGGWWMMIFEGS